MTTLLYPLKSSHIWALYGQGEPTVPKHFSPLSAWSLEERGMFPNTDPDQVIYKGVV